MSWHQRAHYLSNAGLSVRQIASELDVPKSTVHDYLKAREFESRAKILVFDIETAPTLSYHWGRWDQNISQVQVVKESYMLCYAAKWLGDDAMMVDANIRHGDPNDDFEVAASLWALMDEADVVVAHNGDKFDIKKANARFLFYGLPEPSPFRSVDTLKIAKRRFSMPSNKLDSIGEYLGVGRKTEHRGFQMWIDCMNGDRTGWDEMIKYNEDDVLLLEAVYMRMRGWDTSHPNLALQASNDEERCPVCGSTNLEILGTPYRTSVNEYTAYRCQKCKKISRKRAGEKTLEERRKILATTAR